MKENRNNRDHPKVEIQLAKAPSSGFVRVIMPLVPPEEPEKSDSQNPHQSGGVGKPEMRKFYWVLAFVLGAWGVLGWGLPVLILEKSWGSPGELGDSFGMVNALFSGLAFAGVIAAIWLQKKEFQSQLREFEEQTEIQRAQLDHQTQAHKAQLKQQAELHEAQMEATGEQIALLREERIAREKERDLAFAPLFTAEISKMEDDLTEIQIFNGGGPIFRVRLLGDEEHIFFSTPNSPGTHQRESRMIPTLTKEKLVKVTVRRRGLQSPKSGGCFRISFLRGDHAEETYGFSWPGYFGLSKNPIPMIEIFKDDGN